MSEQKNNLRWDLLFPGRVSWWVSADLTEVRKRPNVGGTEKKKSAEMAKCQELFVCIYIIYMYMCTPTYIYNMYIMHTFIYVFLTSVSQT